MWTVARRDSYKIKQIRKIRTFHKRDKINIYEIKRKKRQRLEIKGIAGLRSNATWQSHLLPSGQYCRVSDFHQINDALY